MNQALTDARNDIINNLDPRDGSVRKQKIMAKNLKNLSLLFISDDISEEYEDIN